MFHDPDFMPFTPRAAPSVRVAVSNMIENWPPQAYREGFSVMRGIWPLFPPTSILTDPERIEEILVTRPECFVRDRFQTRALSSKANRDSLFFAEGADWKWQRRAAAPAFRHENLLALVPTFARCAQAQVDAWRGGRDDRTVDVAPAMSQVTFSVILEAVLGGVGTLDRKRFLEAMTPALSTIAWRFFLARMRAPEALPFPGSRRANANVAWLYDATAGLVAQRRAHGAPSTDILGLLLSARDPETGRVMTDDELISNLYTFMVAGHETAATALAWALWLLAKDQATQERLREEILRVVGSREIGSQDIGRLTFAQQVLQEAMRLFPPAYAVGRAPKENMALGPHRLAKGEPVIIATWCLHRHEKLWDEPHAFDPDRFSPEKAKARHRCAYLPFGAGPRICVGMSFAMMEMTVVLATLARALRFETIPGHRIALSTNLTLRAKGGLPLQIRASGT
jgi:cytochrome P450